MNYKVSYKTVSLLISATFLLFFVALSFGYYEARNQENRVMVQSQSQISAHNDVVEDFEDFFAKTTHFDNPKELPVVAFLNPEGKIVSWDDFKGGYTLVNIWATWCTPCVVELPSLEKLQSIFKDNGLSVIAVSVDMSGGQERIKAFLNKRNISDFALYFDKEGLIQKNIPLRGIPTTFLLNPEGQLLYIFEGEADWIAPPAVDFFSKLLN